MSTSKTLKLKSSDGDIFEVEEHIAIQSRTIKNMVEDDVTSGEIPLHNVDSRTLSKLICYWKKHADESVPEESRQEFDSEFINVDQAVLYDLFMAANYLNVEGLLQKLCDKVVSMIKGKSPEEIRKAFNIENDFTPEEEAKILKQNAWAF